MTHYARLTRHADFVICLIGFDLPGSADSIVDGCIHLGDIVRNRSVDYCLSPSILLRWRSLVQLGNTIYATTELSDTHFIIGILTRLSCHHRISIDIDVDRCSIVDDALVEFVLNGYRLVESIYISRPGYGPFLERLSDVAPLLYQIHFMSASMCGDQPVSRIRAHELRIEHLTPNCNPDTIAHTIENATINSLILDNSVPMQAYTNASVETVLVDTPEFFCRFPSLVRLSFIGSFALLRIDSSHCPLLRVACMGPMQDAETFERLVVQIPTLLSAPSGNLSDTAKRRILVKHAPHMLDVFDNAVTGKFHWCPRLHTRFGQKSNKLFGAFLLGVHRLIANDAIPYTDPAALERTLFCFKFIDSTAELSQI